MRARQTDPPEALGLAVEPISAWLDTASLTMANDDPWASSWRNLRGALLVEDVLSEAPVAVDVDDFAADALAIASEEGVHHLLVVQDDVLVGVVCEYDLEQGGADAWVKDCMPDSLITIHPDAGLAEAAEVMRERAVGCLPVVEDGLVVGIVTRGDLRRAGLDAEEVAAPVCASCQSHRHVRLDPRSKGIAFCLECLERALPPDDRDDLGCGD